MGYRSDLVSIVYGKPSDVDEFVAMHTIGSEKTVFDMFNEEGDLVILDTKPTDWAKEGLRVIRLKGIHWKWYPEYEDVKAWDEFLEHANEFGLATEFIRVGEETDDIESNSFAGDKQECHYFLSARTIIECELPQNTPFVYTNTTQGETNE
jgi:hypothetical protein